MHNGIKQIKLETVAENLKNHVPQHFQPLMSSIPPHEIKLSLIRVFKLLLQHKKFIV
jgi:hypothetical protein